MNAIDINATILEITRPDGACAKLGALFGAVEIASDMPRDAKTDLAHIIAAYNSFRAAGGLPAVLRGMTP